MDNPDVIDIEALFDIRVETLANALLDRSAQFQQRQIVIEPLGLDRRRSEREVRDIRLKHYQEETVLHLRIHQKGLFDTLPMGLFIETDEQDTPLKRTRKIKRQTKQARKFFFPFEQLIYHPLIAIDRLEQTWTDRFPKFIESLWGLDDFRDYLDERQTLLLCHVIPHAQRIVGDWGMTASVLRAVMRKPIALHWSEPMTFAFPAVKENSVEDITLGFDTILGDAFQDDSPTLEVQVRGITYNELKDYLPDGKSMYLLEQLLYSYFIPLEVHVVTKVYPTDDAWSGELDRTILGYNVLLS